MSTRINPGDNNQTGCFLPELLDERVDLGEVEEISQFQHKREAFFRFAGAVSYDFTLIPALINRTFVYIYPQSSPRYPHPGVLQTSKVSPGEPACQ
jgi:hypothetical protein